MRKHTLSQNMLRVDEKVQHYGEDYHQKSSFDSGYMVSYPFFLA